MNMYITNIINIIFIISIMWIVVVDSRVGELVAQDNLQNKVIRKEVNIYDLPFDSEIDTKKEKAQPTEPITIKVEDIVEPNSEYHYSSYRKIDPFQPVIIENVSDKKSIYEISVISPLQDDLSKLSVKGILELKDGTKKALIQTADGQAVVATIGDPIGPSGKIIDINSNGVMTRQFKLKADGTREYDDILLAIGEQQKQSKGKIIIEPGKDPLIKTDMKHKK